MGCGVGWGVGWGAGGLGPDASLSSVVALQDVKCEDARIKKRLQTIVQRTTQAVLPLPSPSTLVQVPSALTVQTL